MASAPKSNAAVNAIFAATEAVKEHIKRRYRHIFRMLIIREQKSLGHGTGYKYAHDYPDRVRTYILFRVLISVHLYNVHPGRCVGTVVLLFRTASFAANIALTAELLFGADAT